MAFHCIAMVSVYWLFQYNTTPITFAMILAYTPKRLCVTSTHFGQVNDWWYTVKFGHHTAKVLEEGGAMPNKGSHVKVKVTRDNKTGKISKVSED